MVTLRQISVRSCSDCFTEGERKLCGSMLLIYTPLAVLKIKDSGTKVETLTSECTTCHALTHMVKPSEMPLDHVSLPSGKESPGILQQYRYPDRKALPLALVPTACCCHRFCIVKTCITFYCYDTIARHRVVDRMGQKRMNVIYLSAEVT